MYETKTIFLNWFPSFFKGNYSVDLKIVQMQQTVCLDVTQFVIFVEFTTDYPERIKLKSSFKFECVILSAL